MRRSDSGEVKVIYKLHFHNKLVDSQLDTPVLEIWLCLKQSEKHWLLIRPKPYGSCCPNHVTILVRKRSTYSGLNDPLTCKIRICFTIVDFPDSPAPS